MSFTPAATTEVNESRLVSPVLLAAMATALIAAVSWPLAAQASSTAVRARPRASHGGTKLRVTASAAGGISQLDRETWATLAAGLRLRAGALDVQLRAPLRTSFDRPWELRKRDWDDRSEWLRLAPRLAWSRRAGPGRLTTVSVRIAPTGGATLGHGSLVRGYRSGLLLDRWKSGLRVDVEGRMVGLQLLADDVTSWGIVGARLFVRPFASRRPRRSRRSRRGLTGLSGFTLGVTAAADRNAPLGARQRKGAADAAGRRIRSRTGALVLVGLDLGLPIRLSSRQHLVPYVDANVASLDGGAGGGGGLHAGLWWSWRARLAEVRLRWEARRAQGSYRPGWIDGFYELERTQLGRLGQTKASTWLARADQASWGQLAEARLQTQGGWTLAASWETWLDPGPRGPSDTASLRIGSPSWRGLQLRAAWALRPGVGERRGRREEQHSGAASLRYQSASPWHAWLSAQRTWHAQAGVYRLQLNAAAGVGVRWAW